MLPDWQNVRRLLVIQLGDIEDLMQTEPALQMLRHSLPNTEITLLTIPACKQVAGSWVDDVFVYERITSLNTEREMDLIEKLRDRSFDAAIIFTNKESPYPLAYICYLAGIPIRLGQSQEFGGGVLSQWVKSKDLELQLVDKHLFLLQSAGFSLHPSSLKTFKELKQH